MAKSISFMELVLVYIIINTIDRFSSGSFIAAFLHLPAAACLEVSADREDVVGREAVSGAWGR